MFQDFKFPGKKIWTRSAFAKHAQQHIVWHPVMLKIFANVFHP